MLVICDRNPIATKPEEFPARLVEVASSRLYFASRASLLQLLQQTYSALYSSQYGSQYNSITITKIQGFLVRPDSVRVLVICDRNSIATKREEFPAGLVESSLQSSLLRLPRYPSPASSENVFCTMPAASMEVI